MQQGRGERTAILLSRKPKSESIVDAVILDYLTDYCSDFNRGKGPNDGGGGLELDGSGERKPIFFRRVLAGCS